MNIDFSPTNLSLIREPQNARAGEATDSQNKLVSKKASEAKQVAQDFETLFIEMMLKGMRATVKSDEESNAMDIYQGMLDSEYSKAMASGGSFGVQEMMLNFFKEGDSSLGGGLADISDLKNKADSIKSSMDEKNRIGVYTNLKL